MRYPSGRSAGLTAAARVPARAGAEEPLEAAVQVGLVAEADGLGKVDVPLQIDNGTLTKVVLQRFRGEND